MNPATPFRIKKVTFNDGSTVSLSNMTVFVGPNNVGKSRALSESISFSQSEGLPTQPKPVIVSRVDIDGPSSWQEMVEVLPDPPSLEPTSYTFHSLKSDLQEADGAQTSWGAGGVSAEEAITDAISGSNRKNGLKRFMRGAIVHLKTDTRLSLLADSSTPQSAQRPKNLMQYLYKAGSTIENEISETIHKYFGKKIRLDYSDIQHLRIRFSSDFDDVPSDPRDALKPMAMRERLEEQGDGVRSFTTIVAALKAVQRSIVAIDEPEAFLHPPQAFHIGRIIGNTASNNRQLIVATHSSDVLRGILSTVEDVTIIRIDRTENKNSFCEIDSETLNKITSNPLLSSARVLDGLFYSSVIVTESDADAKFFASAFNHVNKELEAHFVAAENKQTVAKVLRLYSMMGVKHAGIVDFDMLRVETELDQAMIQLDVPQEQRDTVLEIRNLIAKEANQIPARARLENFKDLLADMNGKVSEIDTDVSEEDIGRVLKFLQKRAGDAANITKPWKELKEKGRAGLPSLAQEKFDDLYNLLLGYGLCIYPLGELESSLTDFGLRYTTDKKQWIVEALKMVANLKVSNEKSFWNAISEIINKRLS